MYHPLMPVLAAFLSLKFFGLKLSAHPLPAGVLAAGLTVGMAALSWHLMEKPINDLKRFF